MDVDFCEKNLNGSYRKFVRCYDPLNCNGLGYFTGTWGEWLEKSECKSLNYGQVAKFEL